MSVIQTRACQCGGRPRWVRCVGPVGARPRGEVLRCPACGNRTEPGRSRKRLAAEWNSAGWCGQGPAGDREGATEKWTRAAWRTSKGVLIDLLRDTMRAKARAERRCAALQARRGRRDMCEVVDRLVERGIVAKADADAAKRRITEGGGR